MKFIAACICIGQPVLVITRYVSIDKSESSCATKTGDSYLPPERLASIPLVLNCPLTSASEDELRRLSTEAVRNGAGFTHDVVRIDLEGPALTGDLSLIELPGLIQNAEPEVASLVENIVVSHIKGNCLILVALPMTDDTENQKALRLARQRGPSRYQDDWYVNPCFARIVSFPFAGVLTKPEMLTSGQTKSLEQWVDVIEGRRHPLAHEYHGTRQPNDAERAAAISTGSNKALDLNAIANRREQDKNTVQRMQSVVLVSTGLDTQAPTDLSLEQRNDLLMEEELVELRVKKQAVLDETLALKLKLAGATDEEEE
ncbi:hypothetical protein C8J56DRAFT_1062315 [Mycena floridula]|nr:hypothetical protein C8J56DRAFT_1062315 [Mycena floridula]